MIRSGVPRGTYLGRVAANNTADFFSVDPCARLGNSSLRVSALVFQFVSGLAMTGVFVSWISDAEAQVGVGGAERIEEVWHSRIRLVD